MPINNITTKISGAKQAEAKHLALQTRVAIAWTLANTFQPTAPEKTREKLASNLLQNSTPTLKGMLFQASKNAFNTKLAETFEQVHRTSLNEFLESDASLDKIKGEVESELKGKAKDASSKKADDTKDAGPQPSEYPEPKREEPADIDGDKAADRPEGTTDMSTGKNEKEASKKKAHGKDCKGCPDCKTDKKEAANKKAGPIAEKFTPEEASLTEDGILGKIRSILYSVSNSDPMMSKKKNQILGILDDNYPKAASKTKKAEGEEFPAEAPVVEDEMPEDEIPGDETVDTAVEDSPLPEGEAVVEEEEFDAEEASLEDAIEDTKDAIDTLQDALAEKQDEEDLILPDGEGEGDFTDEDFTEEGVEEEGMEDEFIDDEFDVTDAFNNDNFEEKISSLANEDITAAFDADGEIGLLEVEGDDDFFGPSKPGELEGLLDQEESLSSPADMFAMETSEDPLEALFASSSKRAAATEGIVAPGDLVDYFESDTADTDDRDSENDHEGDILLDVLKKEKPVDQGSKRTPQDSEPELKTAKKKANLKLNPREPRKYASADEQSVVTALFGNDY
jgi:hypothetical protein